MLKASIILPVYNAAATLQAAVKSIGEEERALEILLIDDASADESAALCRALAEKDARIRCLFHAENQGVSAARNDGIKAAKGKWVLFADADDRFAPGAVGQILAYAERLQADLLCFNCLFENRTLRPGRAICPAQFGVPTYAAVQLCEDLFGLRSRRFCGEMFRAVWGKLFLREKLVQSGALFPPRMALGEDCVFLMRFFGSGPKIEFVNAAWYIHSTAGPSAVRCARKDLTKQQMQEYRALLLEKEKQAGADWDTAVYAFLLHAAESWARNARRQGAGLPAVYRKTLHYLQTRPMEAPHRFAPARLPPAARARARFLQHRLWPAEAAAATLLAWKRGEKPVRQRKKRP